MKRILQPSGYSYQTAWRKLTRYLEKVFKCYIFHHHDWTCAASKGIPATKEQLEGGLAGFYDYAKMYCDRCQTESELSKRTREKIQNG